MQSIEGNILVFTDQHFGVKGNSPSRQRMSAMAMKKVIDAVDEHNISACMFCGDYFHQRNALTIDTLNIAHRCLQALAKKCKVYMILGNHDLFNKNSTDINSIRIFGDIDNLVVVDKPIEMLINSKKSLLVPWLADLTTFKKDTYDFMFGHFDISSKFLIASYAQEHSKKLQASDELHNELDRDSDLASSSTSQDELDTSLGSFIDLAKRNSVIFAGHIHQHKEMKVKGRNFIFVGSPYQQNLGDYGCKCGYYVISKNNKWKFYEIYGIPKHVKVECSRVLDAGIDKYDFSEVHNNIVQKVYDVDVKAEDDLKISQKIASSKPYEELLPEYKVALDLSHDSEQSDEVAAEMQSLISKSKLDYIDSYVGQIDSKVLESEGIERNKLLDVMHKYYVKVAK